MLERFGIGVIMWGCIFWAILVHVPLCKDLDIRSQSNLPATTPTGETEHLFSTTSYSQKYEFHRCKECGLIKHFPESSPEELKDHYTGYGNYSDPVYYQKEFERRRSGAKRLIARLTEQLSLSKSRPKILEVGCSSGIVLKNFQEAGWDVYGVEVDPISANLARDQIGSDRIFVGFLTDSPFLDGSFDAAVCDQTIEHVPNPYKLLRDLHRALRPGAVLFIATPNFGGPSFRILKEYWKNTLPGDHISMFTEQTLLNYCSWAGFEVVSKRVGGFSFNARRKGTLRYDKYPWSMANLFFKLVGSALSLFGIGDGIQVICRKAKGGT